VIDARKKAETEATAVTVGAEAEKQAAADQAEAIKTLATAEADAAIIKAKGILETGKAEAESEALLNEARNKLSLRSSNSRSPANASASFPQRSPKRSSRSRRFPTSGSSTPAACSAAAAAMAARTASAWAKDWPAAPLLPGQQADPRQIAEGSRLRGRQCRLGPAWKSRCANNDAGAAPDRNASPPAATKALDGKGSRPK
jgi:hypothetical protein